MSVITKHGPQTSMSRLGRVLLSSLAAVSLTFGACAGNDVGATDDHALTGPVEQVTSDAAEDLVENDAVAEETTLSESLLEVISGDTDLDGDVVCEVRQSEPGPLVIMTATNSGTERSRYWFGLDVFDGNEIVIEGGVVQIRQILPGESASDLIVLSDFFNVAEFSDALTCKTSEVTREPHAVSEATADQQDDIGDCVYETDDESPWISIDIALANDSGATRGYLFDVIIYDDGVRIDDHFSGAELAPGESSNEDVGTTLSNASIDSLTCEVVGIEVFE